MRRVRGDGRTPFARNVVRVLGYHRIADDEDELAVSPKAFRAQMERLLALGARPITLEQAGRLLEEDVHDFYACVTFDDGYHDILTHAVPVLRELQIPATIFVPTGAIDGSVPLYWYATPPPLLSWSELQELSADSLISIGSHTRRHPDLTRLTDEAAWEEIAGSKAALESRLGVPVTSFAYPGGCMNDREARMVVMAGYRVAVTTRRGPNHAGIRPEVLRRDFIDKRDDESLLEAKLAGLLDAPWGIERLRESVFPVRKGRGARLRRLSAVVTGDPPAQARNILSNSGSLTGSVVVTALLGLPYWLLAARACAPEVVGFAAALVAAMTLLGTFGMLGLGTLLAGEFARAEGDRRGHLAPALAIAAAGGAVLGVAFGIAAPRRLGLEQLGGAPGTIALFAAGAGLTSVSLVLDQALIGLGRGGLQLARNLLFALSKLALVAIAAAGALTLGGVGLYATWVAGLVLSLLWTAVLLRRRRSNGRPRRPPARLWAVIREWRTEALKHHLLNVSLQVAPLAMALVVAGTVSVVAAAYYYTASLITNVLAFGAVAITFALYTAGARHESDLARMLRFTLRTSFAFVIAANLVLLVGAPLILSSFGSSYVQNGATVMRLLGVTVLLMVVKDHYVAIARIRGWLTRAAVVCTAGAVLEIGLAAAGGLLGGLDGVVLGRIVALLVEALVMSPVITRELGWSLRATPQVGS